MANANNKLKPADLERIIGAIMAGADIALASMLIGVSERTIYRQAERDPKFKAEMDEARARSDSRVVKRLFDKALDGDTTAMIFWLKNRRPDDWRDRRVLAGDPKAPLLNGPLHLVIDGETDVDADET